MISWFWSEIDFVMVFHSLINLNFLYFPVFVFTYTKMNSAMVQEYVNDGPNPMWVTIVNLFSVCNNQFLARTLSQMTG